MWRIGCVVAPHRLDASQPSAQCWQPCAELIQPQRHLGRFRTRGDPSQQLNVWQSNDVRCGNVVTCRIRRTRQCLIHAADRIMYATRGRAHRLGILLCMATQQRSDDLHIDRIARVILELEHALPDTAVIRRRSAEQRNGGVNAVQEAMIATDSQIAASPVFSTGALPRGLSARKAGERCSCLPVSRRRETYGTPLYSSASCTRQE
jgi:hypothetical protein